MDDVQEPAPCLSRIDDVVGTGILEWLATARAIIKDVAGVTATWRETAKEVGARPAEIARMASAFWHDDLRKALAL